MAKLHYDIGFKSENHVDEELCGDHVEIVHRDDGSSIVVLADGLGSGVKASILSTLTATILSTMLNANISVEDCVDTVAATLPVSSEHGVAYSTFTIMLLDPNGTANLIQFDNPPTLLLRNGRSIEYPHTEINIGGKQIWQSNLHLRKGDILAAMSDGCPYAGPDNSYNMNWRVEDIALYLERFATRDMSARNLASQLVEKCVRLYANRPKDDTTACIVQARGHNAVNILFGPPADRNDTNRMLNLFFAKRGLHVVCGGTTASLAANFLGTTVEPIGQTVRGDIPPMSKIEGVDLTCEGMVTMRRVVEYARDYVGENLLHDEWGKSPDGASRLMHTLFEEATDVNLFVGRAENPAYRELGVSFGFGAKVQIAQELAELLRQMNIHVKVSYF